MNVSAKHQSKMHSNPPVLNATHVQDSDGNHSLSSMAIKARLEGEPSDLPGGKSASLLTTDYGMGKHEAYDSQFAQPAYSGHGKVQTGSTSAL